MDKYTIYLLDQIQKCKKEIAQDPNEKDSNEFLIGELILALTDYKKSPKADGVINPHTNYLLNTIEEYREDVAEDKEEESINGTVVCELVQALVEYQDSISIKA